jgi:hypothetical protein
MRCESAISDGRASARAAAAIAAALLVLGLSTPPAFGQGRGGDDVQYDAVCQNIIGAIRVDQSQTGSSNATADSGGGGEDARGGSARAVAKVAQEQGVSVAQVNECLNGAAENPGVKAATVDDQDKGDVLAATIPKKILPDTGGISLLGLLVVVGLAAIAAGVFVLRTVMSRRA